MSYSPKMIQSGSKEIMVYISFIIDVLGILGKLYLTTLCHQIFNVDDSTGLPVLNSI